MSNAPELFVVVVNYRTADLVIDCLRSLASPAMLPQGTRVVVVDAASNDSSADKFADAIEENGWHSWLDLLPLDVNEGFSYANNRGKDYLTGRYGRPKYVHLLNPDTVAKEGSIVALVDFLKENSQVGICGSQLENLDGSNQCCAFRFPSPIAEFEAEISFRPMTRLLNRWRILPELPDAPTPVGWVSGASIMIRSEVFDDIGNLDEGYFLYHEEVDFCLRAARAGWQCWYVPKSHIIHLCGQSTGVTVLDRRPGRRPAYWFESRHRYFRKNHGSTYTLVADASWVAGHVLGVVWRTIRRKPNLESPYLLRDFLKHAWRANSRKFKDARAPH
ncbi:glycosyltransferase family 2 protein [Rhizobium sp. S152]|uniref:glycosyltransferase family 2 protein n=1 Tax=Rhizobium sp. S152 TaxID=3055038 RepID=UPI0025A974F0|nr:glycosyltransferase family 2 protein [Rhizobium sp. S152]MDM9624872.1 glycosyltransferase family 2 protein [Rhizobium sp. S152]